MIVTAYLAAVIAANLSATAFGPDWTIVNAFLFIGFDLTMRDHLHETWKGDPKRMAGLIAAGSVLSWLVNRDSGKIAVASLIAFAAAGLTDWIVYQIRQRQPRWRKQTESNVVSAAVDSLVFPTLAFGSVLPWITLGQWIAKIAGGGIWTWLLRNRRAATGS